MIKKRKKDPAEIPSSSLADIAFLLLIFFLVTTTINVDKGIKMVLPPKIEKVKPIPPKNLTKILVDANGNILMNGEVVTVNDVYSMAIDKLRTNDKMVFSVQTTRKTKYDIFIRVLDQLKRAGAKRISIAEPVEV
jgi:biopolymer transport protein ExbD